MMGLPFLRAVADVCACPITPYRLIACPSRLGSLAASVVKWLTCSWVTCGAYMRATRSRCDSWAYQVSSRSRI